MDAVFLQVLNMSFTGGVVILAVLIGRLLLRKAPRIFSYTLWSIVLFRLICPVTISLPISLLPVNSRPVSSEILTQTSPAVNTGIPFLDETVNTLLPAAAAGDSVNPLQVWVAVGSWLWLIGAAVLLGCSLICLFRLRRKLKGAVSDGSNIMVSQKVDTPFVIGFSGRWSTCLQDCLQKKKNTFSCMSDPYPQEGPFYSAGIVFSIVCPLV